ncbi:segregation/condensation protein A [Archaeoglobales archaeon]|nr:MAG: segregation/condensation protein A [Archaeoglobales archaeon]
MLVEMAKKGEIDPWNIDVVDVAARFLERLERAQKLDLRISGRVLLYAAILIRMKAEILSQEASRVKKEEPEIIPDEIDFGEFFNTEFETGFEADFDLGFGDFDEKTRETGDELIDSLISVQRKTTRRFTTLKDLIRELQMAENVEKRRKIRKKVEREEAIKQTLETPHEEDIEDILIKVENELLKLFRRKDLLYFSEVVRGKEKDKLTYYLSILHLAFRKILEVRQEKLFEADIELRLYR